MTVYTVIGVWQGDDALVTGVIEGDHSVSGGDLAAFPGGCWSTSVGADSVKEAGQAARREMEGTSECEDT